jgi:hypothetical protein
MTKSGRHCQPSKFSWLWVLLSQEGRGESEQGQQAAGKKRRACRTSHGRSDTWARKAQNGCFRGFSAPFPIVRKRFMVTGDFTQRELDHLEISKA